MRIELGARGCNILPPHQERALLHLAAQMPRNGRKRLGNADIVVVRLALPANFQDVTKALRCDQGRVRGLALDERVCRNRRAVAKVAHLDGLCRGRRQDFGDASLHRHRWIGRRRRRLVQEGLAVGQTDHHQISERAADIDAEHIAVVIVLHAWHRATRLSPSHRSRTHGRPA